MNVEMAAQIVQMNLDKLSVKYKGPGKSLLDAYIKNPNRFSEKQANFLMSIAAYVQKQNEPKPDEMAVVKVAGSIEPIYAKLIEMFKSAKSNGLLRPKIRLMFNGQKIVLSMASETARYPGTINVSDGGPFGNSKFFGRINSTMFYASSTRLEGLEKFLIDFSSNPMDSAKMYGQQTGMCCMCGRTLTDKESIAAGIGPICAGKFGM